jgi:GNAT superfamily N-acetyltransferase
MSFVCRAATNADIPFIVEAILESERVVPVVGATMYSLVYQLNLDEARAFIRESLAQPLNGCQLALRAFRVVTEGDRTVGCAAAWTEAVGALPSGHLLAMLISRSIGAARWREQAAAVRALASAAPNRARGTLQLESFFVAESARGRGVAGLLIDHALRAASASELAPTMAQISLLAENERARRAYAANGFVETWQSPQSDDAFFTLTRSIGFIQMTRVLTGPTSHP